MTQRFVLHPTHPQARALTQVAAAIRDGAVIAYPTDSGYALGCALGQAEPAARLRAIRGLDDKHLLTLMLPDLAALGHFARLDNWQFRIVRRGVPGPFTFIVPGTREVPKRLLHPRRSTVGVRVPAHIPAHALLHTLGGPLLSTSLIFPGESDPPQDVEEIAERARGAIDVVIEAGSCPARPTTVIDLAQDPPVLLRRGQGDPASLGLPERVEGEHGPEVG